MTRQVLSSLLYWLGRVPRSPEQQDAHFFVTSLMLRAIADDPPPESERRVIVETHGR